MTPEERQAHLGKIIEGFLLGFGAAFGWALGNGLIALVAGALMSGRHG